MPTDQKRHIIFIEKCTFQVAIYFVALQILWYEKKNNFWDFWNKDLPWWTWAIFAIGFIHYGYYVLW